MQRSKFKQLIISIIYFDLHSDYFRTSFDENLSLIFCPVFFSNRLLTQAAGIASDMKNLEEAVSLMERAW